MPHFYFIFTLFMWMPLALDCSICRLSKM